MGLLLVVLAMAVPNPVSAQNFSLDRSSIAGGGGTSTNGALRLTGTIGQRDAGTKLAGGTYALEPGFWSVAIAVQTAGAPQLSVVRIGGTVFISWPSETVGFELEQTSNLRPPATWTPVAGVASNSLITPATPGTHFFRLRKP